jgi:epoxyqueuosine reductase
MNPADTVKRKAIDLGFDLVGITDAAAIDAGHIESFENWLRAGFAGQMGYMHRNLGERFNPTALFEGAHSVVVVALNYKPSEISDDAVKVDKYTGRIAHYARYVDYHIFIKSLLRQLADFITSEIDEQARFKLCVDSVPLAERALAQRAGLGFIGKNRMLINTQLGPEILLGELITTAQLETDKPVEQNCEKCNKCVEACPTGALRADGRFDAAKCISYLTIEHAGDIKPSLAHNMNDQLFGCDKCILACPYYYKAPVCTNKHFKYYPQNSYLNLETILAMTEDDFDNRFRNSPIHRSGLDMLKRNTQICLDNIVGFPAGAG